MAVIIKYCYRNFDFEKLSFAANKLALSVEAKRISKKLPVNRILKNSSFKDIGFKFK